MPGKDLQGSPEGSRGCPQIVSQSGYLKETVISTGPFGSRPVYLAFTVDPGFVGIILVIVPRERRSPFFNFLPSAARESLIQSTTASGSPRRALPFPSAAMTSPILGLLREGSGSP